MPLMLTMMSMLRSMSKRIFISLHGILGDRDLVEQAPTGSISRHKIVTCIVSFIRTQN